MNKKTIKDIARTELKGKTVLVRVDFNVPMQDGKITDDTRIRAALPTLKYLRESGAKLVLMSHLGRPKGVTPEFTLAPVAIRLSELLETPVKMAKDCIGPDVEKIVASLKEGEVCMLENVRFHPEEEKNEPNFTAQLAKLGQIYVNDAFGTAHRAHASTAGIAKHLPAYAGFLIEKEITYLGQVLTNPQRPLVVIIGGAKVGTKIDVLNKMADVVGKDGAMLIGGGMAYTFYKAQGLEIGKSLLDPENIETAKNFLKKTKEKGITVLFPLDVVVADDFKNDAKTQIVPFDKIPASYQGMDIGPRTIKQFEKEIKKARTIVWNGPMGVFEMENFAKGTNAIAHALAKCKAITIVGGGDSVAAIEQMGLADKMTHVSLPGMQNEKLQMNNLFFLGTMKDYPPWVYTGYIISIPYKNNK